MEGMPHNIRADDTTIQTAIEHGALTDLEDFVIVFYRGLSDFLDESLFR